MIRKGCHSFTKLPHKIYHQQESFLITMNEGIQCLPHDKDSVFMILPNNSARQYYEPYFIDMATGSNKWSEKKFMFFFFYAMLLKHENVHSVQLVTQPFIKSADRTVGQVGSDPLRSRYHGRMRHARASVGGESDLRGRIEDKEGWEGQQTGIQF